MTPHDAWDYDGINEMVLTDSQVGGATVPTLTHFDRNGFAYLLDRRNGKLLKASKFDPSVKLGQGNRHEDRPARGRTPTKMTKADVNVKGICPAAMGAKNHAARVLRSADQAVLCGDQPHLHGLSGVQR